MPTARSVRLVGSVLIATLCLWLLLVSVQSASASPSVADAIVPDRKSSLFKTMDSAAHFESELTYIANQGVENVPAKNRVTSFQTIDPSGDSWPSRAPSAVLHVCPNECAYSSVQAAVDAANDGDVIKVASGTYTDVHQRNGITQVVYISKTVTIQGGYTNTNWTTSYPITQPTTLDAQGQGRVMVITGNISPTIDRLRITGGDATGLSGGLWGKDSGGGMYIITATATITSNYIFSNTANVCVVAMPRSITTPSPATLPASMAVGCVWTVAMPCLVAMPLPATLPAPMAVGCIWVVAIPHSTETLLLLTLPAPVGGCTSMAVMPYSVGTPSSVTCLV
jgi:hypothetical protein